MPIQQAKCAVSSKPRFNCAGHRALGSLAESWLRPDCLPKQLAKKRLWNGSESKKWRRNRWNNLGQWVNHMGWWNDNLGYLIPVSENGHCYTVTYSELNSHSIPLEIQAREAP